jgi:hypothetical protein
MEDAVSVVIVVENTDTGRQAVFRADEQANRRLTLYTEDAVSVCMVVENTVPSS